MDNKMQITRDDLDALAKIAQHNGKTTEFAVLALEWAGEAESEIGLLRAENKRLRARNKHLLKVLKRVLPGLQWARSTLGNGTHIGYSIAEISRVLKEAAALAAKEE